MDKNLPSIDKHFQDAFGAYEAPYSPSEMQGDWSQVSAHLPQAPIIQPPVNATLWGGGKILSFAGAAAVAVTAGILIYNTLQNKEEKSDTGINNPVAEQLVPGLDKNNESGNSASVNDFSTIEDTRADGDQVENSGPADPIKNNTRHTPGLPLTDRKTDKDGQGPGMSGNEKGQDDTKRDNMDPTVKKDVTKPDKKEDERKNSVLPAPGELYLSDSILCAGEEITLENDAPKASDKIIVEWGDGDWAMLAKDQRHTYVRPGKYTLKILHGDEMITRTVQVEKTPFISFTMKVNGMEAAMRNRSDNDLIFRWDFGDESPMITGNSPKHQYRDTGRYIVTLTATSGAGCKSTASSVVYARKAPYIDNVITPNGDGKNDELVVDLEDATYFLLEIYSPENKLVFRSNDKNHKWNGRDMNGQPCKPGALYSYLLQYKYRGDSEIRELPGRLELR